MSLFLFYPSIIHIFIFAVLLFISQGRNLFFLSFICTLFIEFPRKYRIYADNAESYAHMRIYEVDYIRICDSFSNTYAIVKIP